jgi:hypothetical protein
MRNIINRKGIIRTDMSIPDSRRTEDEVSVRMRCAKHGVRSAILTDIVHGI